MQCNGYIYVDKRLLWNQKILKILFVKRILSKKIFFSNLYIMGIYCWGNSVKSKFNEFHTYFELLLCMTSVINKVS